MDEHDGDAGRPETHEHKLSNIDEEIEKAHMLGEGWKRCKSSQMKRKEREWRRWAA